MFDNLKIMNKDIKCKRCGTDMKFKDSICQHCGQRNDKPFHLLIGAISAVVAVIIIIIIIISSIVSSVKKANENKVTYKWPTSGVATLLPEPNLEYGRILSESADYFAINLYYAEKKDFDNYVEKCKEKGFTVGYEASDGHYRAKDGNGNQLSVSYYDLKGDPEINISIESAQKIAEREAKAAQSKSEQEAKKQAEEATKAQKAAEDAQKAKEASAKVSDAFNNLKDTAKTSKNTDFKKWVDDYEKFMNEYVDFMSSYDASDYKQLAKYTKLYADYVKWLNDTQNLNQSDYSEEDWQYLLDAEARVAQKLSTVQVQ